MPGKSTLHAITRKQFLLGSAAAVGALGVRALTRTPSAWAQEQPAARNAVQEFRFVAGDGASTSDLPSLDFITAGLDLGIITAGQFQIGLIYQGGDAQIYPGLAQSWSVSDDRLTYTFNLYPNLRWSDGSPLTAQDIKYSYNRFVWPETKSQATTTVLGSVAGIDAALKGDSRDISGIQAPDDNTITITVKAPNVAFPLSICQPWGWSWVKQSLYEPDPDAYWAGQNGLPLATGPMKLDQWIQGDRITFSRNPYFHLEPANLDTMQFLFNRDASTLLVAYENNELDNVSVDPQDVERFNAPGLPHSSELKSTYEGELFLSFKVSLPPMDDPLVRLAFYQAIDRNTIGTQVFRDVWRGAKSLQAPDYPWFDPQIQWPQYDPQAAQANIAQSKYGSVKNFPKIRTTDSTATGSRSHRLAVALQQMWKDNLGVDVELKATEFPYEAAGERRQVVFGDWGGVQDPGWIPVQIYQSQSNRNMAYTGLTQDDGSQKDFNVVPELDALIADAESTQDPQERARKHNALERRAMQDAAIFPLFHQYDYMLMKPWVMDYVPKLIFFDFYALKPSNIWIAEHR